MNRTGGTSAAACRMKTNYKDPILAGCGVSGWRGHDRTKCEIRRIAVNPCCSLGVESLYCSNSFGVKHAHVGPDGCVFPATDTEHGTDISLLGSAFCNALHLCPQAYRVNLLPEARQPE
jgi:hypothetical protein